MRENLQTNEHGAVQRRSLLLGAAAVAVLTATLTPWRAREEHAGAAVPTTDQPTAR